MHGRSEPPKHAPIASYSFSLANVDVNNVYTKSVYHYSGPQSIGCYGYTTQYSCVDNVWSYDGSDLPVLWFEAS